MTEYNKNDFVESDNKKIEQVLKMLNDMVLLYNQPIIVQVIERRF